MNKGLYIWNYHIRCLAVCDLPDVQQLMKNTLCVSAKERCVIEWSTCFLVDTGVNTNLSFKVKGKTILALTDSHSYKYSCFRRNAHMKLFSCIKAENVLCCYYCNHCACFCFSPIGYVCVIFESSLNHSFKKQVCLCLLCFPIVYATAKI